MKLNNELYSGVFQRVLETTFFIGVAAFVGFFTVAAAPSLFSVMGGGGWGYSESGALLGRFLTLPVLLVSGGIFFCLFLLVGLSTGWGTIRINLDRSQNICLLLIGASVVFPILPVQMVTVLLAVLLGLSLIFSPQGRIVGYGFRLLFGLFITLMLLGVLVSVFQIDDVRSRIPMSRQLVGALPYLTAFLVYYGFQRNRWELPDLEKILRFFVLGSAFLSIEALGTWYIGRDSLPFPLIGTSLGSTGLFESFLIRNHHVVSRIALIAVFGSLYFYARYGLKRDLIFMAIAGLPMVASLDRAPLLATVVGVGFYMALSKAGIRLTHGRLSSQRILIRGVIGILALLLAGYAANFALQRVTLIRDASNLAEVFNGRLVHHARALDVFVYTPVVGTGPQLDQFYQASSFVPRTYLNSAVKTFGVSPGWAADRISTEGFQREGGVSHSAHSLWLEFIMHWGILGLFAFCYLLYMAVKVFGRLLTSREEAKNAAWAIFMLAGTLSASMITTSKFRYWWVLVFAYFFVSRCLEAIERERKGEFA